MSTSDSYVVSTEVVQHTLRAEISGETIVESRKALALYGTRHSPVYYFPKEDVRMDLLSPTEHRTHCPFKGDATYWSVTVGGQTLENVTWRYESFYPDASEIIEYIAFNASKIDSLWKDAGKCVAHARQCGAHAACKPSGAVGDHLGMGCCDKPRPSGGLCTLVDVKWYLHIAASGHHSSPSPHDCRH